VRIAFDVVKIERLKAKDESCFSCNFSITFIGASPDGKRCRGFTVEAWRAETLHYNRE